MSYPEETERMGSGKEGRYANYFNVGHNAFEVILQFGQYYQGNAQPQLHTTIVTAPAYAKTLLEILKCCFEEYEAEFGPVPDPDSHT
jgi:hypothetical protein